MKPRTAEEKLDGRRQKADVPAHARTACWIVPRGLQSIQKVKALKLNWTELSGSGSGDTVVKVDDENVMLLVKYVKRETLCLAVLCNNRIKIREGENSS